MVEQFQVVPLDSDMFLSGYHNVENGCVYTVPVVFTSGGFNTVKLMEAGII